MEDVYFMLKLVTKRKETISALTRLLYSDLSRHIKVRQNALSEFPEKFKDLFGTHA